MVLRSKWSKRLCNSTAKRSEAEIQESSCRNLQWDPRPLSPTEHPNNRTVQLSGPGL